jgi:hypothetical protein
VTTAPGGTTDQDRAGAQAIWDYHQMHHLARPCSAGIGLGSHDLGVATLAADLYLAGLFPVLVFTGANSPTTAALLPRGEACAMPGLVCAIHQPNFFPRLSTLAKLYAADVWVILDDVQFSRRDYQHRCYLPAGAGPARGQPRGRLAEQSRCHPAARTARAGDHCASRHSARRKAGADGTGGREGRRVTERTAAWTGLCVMSGSA